MPIQTPARTSSAPRVAPETPLARKENSPQTQQQQKQPPAQQKKKMGIAAALLLVFVASSYDALDIIITIIGFFTGIDDYGILDILYLPTTIGFWIYFHIKKTDKRGLFLLAYLIEWIPYLDVLNLQIVYALIIIWTNMTKSGEKMAKSVPTPKLKSLPSAT